MFSKKATKIVEIFNVDLTVCSKCQIDGEDLSNFLAFLENTNFTCPSGFVYLPTVLLCSLTSRAVDKNQNTQLIASAALIIFRVTNYVRMYVSLSITTFITVERLHILL